MSDSIPQLDDRVCYVIAAPTHPLYWTMILGTITCLFANGNVEFTPDPGQGLDRKVSLPRRWQKPFQPNPAVRFKGQYGLTLV